MAYSMTLPPGVPKDWKVKIRDRERLEPPHVTVINGRRAWRFNLRAVRWMDDDPDPNDVPQSIRDAIHANLDRLRSEWDRMYPGNPSVATEGDDD